MGGVFRKNRRAPFLTGDTALIAAHSAFLKKDYEPARKLLSVRSSNLRYFFADQLAHELIREQVLAWAENAPNCQAAALLRAAQGIVWAWDAKRGDGGDWRDFGDRLKVLETEIRQLVPHDPNRPALQLVLGKGADWDHRTLQATYQEGHNLNPNHYPVHRNYLETLLARSGGSHEAALSFATKTMEQCGDGSNLGTLVMTALSEQWLAMKSFGQESASADILIGQPRVLQLTEEAYRKSLGSPHYEETHASVVARNEAAFWFFVSKQRPFLKAELQKLKGRYMVHPWGTLAEPRKAFEAARRMARG